MPTLQQVIQIRTPGRGWTELTGDVARIVRAARAGEGLVHVFARHTSCSVVITENADPSVRADLEMLAGRFARDGDPAYRHDTEGDDDMAAHGRSMLAGNSVTVPVGGGKMLLGTWQGIYLWEHRTGSQSREVVVTVVG